MFPLQSEGPHEGPLSEFVYSRAGDNSCPYDFESHQQTSRLGKGADGSEQSISVDFSKESSSAGCWRYVCFTFLLIIIYDVIVMLLH